MVDLTLKRGDLVRVKLTRDPEAVTARVSSVNRSRRRVTLVPVEGPLKGHSYSVRQEDIVEKLDNP